MQRRDLILGGVFGLAAARASAQIPADRAPASDAVPLKVPGEYGETMNIMFTTSTDLNAFMPPGLTAVNPHRAFIKAQRKKGGTSKGYPPAGPHASGLQIGISTMATTPKFGPRQRNILMWESLPWGIGSTLVGVKRWADAEMTYMFEQDRKLVAEGSPVPFHLDVQQYGFSLLSFQGVLDGVKRVEDAPYTGMYVGGEPGADLLSLTFDDTDFSRPIHGTGTLSFGSIPIERAPAGPGKGWPSTLLKDITVEGCIFQDMAFTRSYGTEFETVRKALPAA
uniref:hypothetical protein n=1 Tax=uncultured Caulobacter sp. TaxID=158749 RepID=UPI0025DE610E|nr:hypothetical protein [uncultured Caulobacter sp.]